MSPFELTLYIASSTETSRRAVANLQRLTAGADGQFDVRIVDVVKDPAAAWKARVVATPLLVRTSPAPVVKVLGDLANSDHVRAILGLPPPTPPPRGG